MRNVTVPLDQRRLNFTDPTVCTQPYQPSDRCVITQLVTDCQSPGMAGFRLSDSNGAGKRVGERLLAEDVFPGVKRRPRQRLMSRRRRGDGHEIHLRIRDQVRCRLITTWHLVRSTKLLEPPRINVG